MNKLIKFTMCVRKESGVEWSQVKSNQSKAKSNAQVQSRCVQVLIQLVGIRIIIDKVNNVDF